MKNIKIYSIVYNDEQIVEYEKYFNQVETVEDKSY